MRLPLRRLLPGSWLLGSRSRWLSPRPRRRTGLALLVAFTAAPLGAVLAVLALSVPLAVLFLAIRRTRALAWGEICRRRLLVATDDDLGAVGQIGEARGDDLVVRRQAARNDRIMLVLLRHRDGLGRDHVVLADDVAEGADRPTLHGGRRHHQRLCQGNDLEADIDDLARPELVVGVGKFRL